MKKVSEDCFFRKINPMDVTIDVKGSYPYTSIFRKRGGDVVGKIVHIQFKDAIYYLQEQEV